MKWEYKIIDLGAFPLNMQYEPDLISMGQEGWELICIIDSFNMLGSKRYYFKRQLC